MNIPKVTKSQQAKHLMEEMRVMLNDIAASATILGSTPFDGGPACKALAASLHEALMIYEMEMAALGLHEFKGLSHEK